MFMIPPLSITTTIVKAETFQRLGSIVATRVDPARARSSQVGDGER
jgi:hypothetical protein